MSILKVSTALHSQFQVRELKAKHPSTVLMIQSGYKMLFFEEDARVCYVYLCEYTITKRACNRLLLRNWEWSVFRNVTF